MPDDTLTQPADGGIATQGDVVLQVDGLRKRYGDNEVVRGLSFTINRGD